jgi:ATP-dependent RNA helicase DDX51/DBP6
MIVLPPDLKPLNLLHLLHSPQFEIKSALCFTKSVDSTERLLRLLEFFEDAYTAGGRLVAKSYSGELETSVRRKLLAEFAKGKIDLFVDCT